jgi:hypothetical protein
MVNDMNNSLEGSSQGKKPNFGALWMVGACVCGALLYLGIGPLAKFWLPGLVSLNANPLSTAVDVQRHLIGVWTYARPTDMNKPPHGWERWTFKSSGLEIQSARPSDMSWGAPSIYGYEIERRKTADSGQWYWHVRVKATKVNAAVMEDGGVVAFWAGSPESNYRLIKEDKDLSK